MHKVQEPHITFIAAVAPAVPYLAVHRMQSSQLAKSLPAYIDFFRRPFTIEFFSSAFFSLFPRFIIGSFGFFGRIKSTELLPLLFEIDERYVFPPLCHGNATHTKFVIPGWLPGTDSGCIGVVDHAKFGLDRLFCHLTCDFLTITPA